MVFSTALELFVSVGKWLRTTWFEHRGCYDKIINYLGIYNERTKEDEGIIKIYVEVIPV